LDLSHSHVINLEAYLTNTQLTMIKSGFFKIFRAWLGVRIWWPCTFSTKTSTFYIQRLPSFCKSGCFRTLQASL